MEKHNLEKISLYKLFLTILATGLYGTSSWLFINRNTINANDKIFVTLIAIIIFFAMLLCIYKSRYYIDKLKDED